MSVNATPCDDSFAALTPRESSPAWSALRLNLCTAAGMRGSLPMALLMASECTRQLRGRSTAESIC